MLILALALAWRGCCLLDETPEKCEMEKVEKALRRGGGRGVGAAITGICEYRIVDEPEGLSSTDIISGLLLFGSVAEKMTLLSKMKSNAVNNEDARIKSKKRRTFLLHLAGRYETGNE